MCLTSKLVFVFDHGYALIVVLDTVVVTGFEEVSVLIVVFVLVGYLNWF